MITWEIPAQLPGMENGPWWSQGAVSWMAALLWCSTAQPAVPDPCGIAGGRPRHGLEAGPTVQDRVVVGSGPHLERTPR